MYIFYKYSDKGKQPILNNNSLNKKDLFLNLYKEFINEHFYLFLDNCLKESLLYFKSFNFEKYFISNQGVGLTFLSTINEAIQLNNEDIVYFVEDDYIHDKNSKKCLLEGIEIADYVSLYDCPDKYINFIDNGNPFIYGNGEDTKVLLSKSSHWKYTNSTTGSFAAKVNIIKEDYNIIKSFVGLNSIGQSDFKDFLYFTESRKRGRHIISPIPSKSTHIVNGFPYNAPLINWEKVLENK